MNIKKDSFDGKMFLMKEGQFMLPFAMLKLDKMTNKERGYSLQECINAIYNPTTQVSNLSDFGGTLVLSSLEERDSDTKCDDED